MKAIRFVVIVLLVFIAGFCSGFFCRQKPQIQAIETRTDTIVVYDTIMSYLPIYAERHTLDTILIAVQDTVTVHDTLYATLEREQLVWRDSLSVIYASGFAPQVDSVQHFITQRVIERQVMTKPKWSIGLQIGVNSHLEPYIGVGLQYCIANF